MQTNEKELLKKTKSELEALQKQEMVKLQALKEQKMAEYQASEANNLAYQAYQFINNSLIFRTTYLLECNKFEDWIEVITNGKREIIELNKPDSLDKIKQLWQRLRELQDKLEGGNLESFE